MIPELIDRIVIQLLTIKEAWLNITSSFKSITGLFPKVNTGALATLPINVQLALKILIFGMAFYYLLKGKLFRSVVLFLLGLLLF